jgi:hypothetical protein
MFSKEAIISAAVALARIVVRTGRSALTAISRAEAAQAALAQFETQYAAALTSWREKKASFIGFLVKLGVAYATDYFLLEPLARALTMRLFPGAGILSGIVAAFAPVPVIVTEAAIAVRYQRAKDWEARFGTNQHSTRWLVLGFVVAAIPATIVIALGMMSTVTAVVLGWAALAGRQALNIILGVISFALHVLLVLSGETPRELVDALLAVLGRARRKRVADAAHEEARRRYDAAVTVATRYEAARVEHDAVHGPLTVYPFPESVIALLRRELPNFGRPRAGSGMPFIPVEPEYEDEGDATLH